jgi:membrane protease YdiL (CAAX protease family)
MVLIGVSEILLAVMGAALGIACHAILVVGLLSHYAIRGQAPHRRALPVLALMPLLRILSLTVSIKEIPHYYWYAMVGVPWLLAAALTARLLDLSWMTLNLRPSSWRLQIAIALSGIPLSIAAFLILKPQPLVARFDWHKVVIAAGLLTIFTGFTEEIVFRGMLQQVGHEIFGRGDVLFSSALFAIMYISSLSLGYVFFIGLVGLFFGWCVKRTGSIWGVMLAHSVLAIGMLLVWPILWR